MEKPFVARQILEVLTKKKIEIACTCTTGIACTLYERCSARTIHSFAGIGQCRGKEKGNVVEKCPGKQRMCKEMERDRGTLYR